MKKIVPGFVLAVSLAVFVGSIVGQQPAPAPGAPDAPKGGGKGGFGGGKGGRGGKADTAPTTPAPRMADGKMDFSGNWNAGGINLNVNLAGAMGNGNVPWLPWSEKLHAEREAAISKDDPEARCLPPGVPRMNTTPYPFTIMQNDKQIIIVYEGGAHVWRKIFLDGRKHDPNAVETWLGDSTGKWIDNDTLEVETVGQTDRSWLDEGGMPHTKDMVVTETFTRRDLGHMTIVNTINDPGAYSKPWSFTTNHSQLRGELIEYICQENNRDLEHLVGK